MTSCVLTDAELAQIFAESSNSSQVSLTFRRGDILDWDTGVGKGTMKVLSVNGGKFTLEQNNEKNLRAEDIIMSGEVFADGRCKIENVEYNEVWEGNLTGNALVGKVNDLHYFKISWQLPKYMSYSAKSVSKFPFSKGDVLKWTAGSARGTMKIISINGDDFVAEKFNDFDKNRKAVKMYASLSKDGVCVLKDSAGKEIWKGVLSSNIISGQIKGGYNFKIVRSNSVWDMPFKTGDSLTWNVNYRKGKAKVANVTSIGKFVLDIYPPYSNRLKETSLDGEIMPDGTYKLLDRKDDKIWIGRRDGSQISGKINNSTKFIIDGLK